MINNWINWDDVYLQFWTESSDEYFCLSMKFLMHSFGNIQDSELKWIAAMKKNIYKSCKDEEKEEK